MTPYEDSIPDIAPAVDLEIEDEDISSSHNKVEEVAIMIMKESNTTAQMTTTVTR